MSLFPTTRSGLFDDLFNDVASGFYVKPLHGQGLPKQIKVQVGENAESYSIQAELPGVNKEDIHVDIDGAVVTLKAEVKQHDSQKDGDQILRSERYYGSVSRSFELPQEVETEHASAKYENGILILNLPKRQQKAGTKRLEIQ
ncbi:MAG: heat-shock protein Hsp20 [Oleibacter sp.]|nr:heat-shock protein Hsp20 [Thalassolituus sp.]|tara:strand:- start:171 stop:599 length:429 start_codon:yes stop_codon:yes gene_type:complete